MQSFLKVLHYSEASEIIWFSTIQYIINISWIHNGTRIMPCYHTMNSFDLLFWCIKNTDKITITLITIDNINYFYIDTLFTSIIWNFLRKICSWLPIFLIKTIRSFVVLFTTPKAYTIKFLFLCLSDFVSHPII